MKNYKGGYLLISLGMVALASITALPSGTVEKIKASSKRIVLTDISLDGVKQENDITVQPIISGTSVIIKGVYGKDITIASDDSVTISNSQSVGTKLYKHKIEKDGYSIEYVSNSNQEKNLNGIIGQIRFMASGTAFDITSQGITGTLYQCSKMEVSAPYPGGEMLSFDEIIVYNENGMFYMTNGSSTSAYPYFNEGIDTVTPL